MQKLIQTSVLHKCIRKIMSTIYSERLSEPNTGDQIIN